MRKEYLELINIYGKDTLKRWEQSLSLFQAERHQFNRGEFADVFVYRHIFSTDQEAFDVLTSLGVPYHMKDKAEADKADHWMFSSAIKNLINPRKVKLDQEEVWMEVVGTPHPHDKKFILVEVKDRDDQYSISEAAYKSCRNIEKYLLAKGLDVQRPIKPEL